MELHGFALAKTQIDAEGMQEELLEIWGAPRAGCGAMSQISPGGSCEVG